MTDLLLVVSLWIRPGQADAFAAYERRIVPILSRHGGQIERTIRVVLTDADGPFEVHLVRFPSPDAFDRYRADPDTLTLAAERARIIARTDLVRGSDGPSYG